MMVDSLEMTDADRRLILENCRAAAEERDRRSRTAPTPWRRRLASLGEAALGKTIVLTGAMVPYAFGSSDGLFNLGSALSFVQALPHGVYIAMNGRCFTWDDVVKNRQLGIFETKT